MYQITSWTSTKRSTENHVAFCPFPTFLPPASLHTCTHVDWRVGGSCNITDKAKWAERYVSRWWREAVMLIRGLWGCKGVDKRMGGEWLLVAVYPLAHSFSYSLAGVCWQLSSLPVFSHSTSWGTNSQALKLAFVGATTSIFPPFLFSIMCCAPGVAVAGSKTRWWVLPAYNSSLSRRILQKWWLPKALLLGATC